jgi:Kef-type K+ transport system membrane component KefB
MGWSGWVVLGQAAPPAGLTADAVLAFVLLDLVIILAAARLVGGLFRRVGQPRVVGEIVAGVLLGPTLLGPKLFTWTSSWQYLQCDASLSAPSTPPAAAESVTWCLFPQQARGVLGILGQLALVFFMFLVGLELDFGLLRGRGRAIGLVSVGAVAVPVGLAFLVGPLLYDAKWVGAPDGTLASQSSFTLFLAAMLAVTAFPVMARILQEKGLTQSAMGSVGVAAAAVVTVLMFLAVAVAAGVASHQGPSSLALKFVVTAIYLAVLFLVVRPALVPLGRRYEERGLSADVFALILVVLLASAYAAHKIGVNVIVGGFLAGAILPARVALFRDMAARLADFTAIFLLPVFLAFSGLNTDFTTLGVSFVAGIALFLVAGVVGKWLGSAVFARAGGLSWAEGNVIGILMNCRGLLVLVVALIGFQLGIISPQMQVGGVVMALVTTAMTGPLFDAFAARMPREAPKPLADVAGAPPDAFRVVAALDNLDHAPAVVHAAYRLVGDRRPAEVDLVRPFSLRSDHEILIGINDTALEIERSLRALRMLRQLAPPGVTVVPFSSATTDPASEHLRVATSREADVIVVGVNGRGRDVVGRLTRRAGCPVVAYHLGTLDGEGVAGGPVTIVGPPSPAVTEVAGQLALGTGSVVEQVGDGDTAAVVEAGRRSAAIVAAAGTQALAGQEDDFGCPVYVVHEALAGARA